MLIPIIITIVAGYFLGALPFGFIVSRAQGINIFEHGSKNPGATNVLRVLSEKLGKKGKRLGIMVFALDALKGVVAAGWLYLACALGVWQLSGSDWTTLRVLGLVGALVGHSFSCFTYFKGGKGIATGAGGLLVLMPFSILSGAIIWVLLFETTRYVSLASIIAALSLPLIGFLTYLAWGYPQMLVVWVSLAIAVFVAIRHRANIARLWNGTESKFVKKTPPPQHPATPAA